MDTDIRNQVIKAASLASQARVLMEKRANRWRAGRALLGDIGNFGRGLFGKSPVARTTGAVAPGVSTSAASVVPRAYSSGLGARQLLGGAGNRLASGARDVGGFIKNRPIAAGTAAVIGGVPLAANAYNQSSWNDNARYHQNRQGWMDYEKARLAKRIGQFRAGETDSLDSPGFIGRQLGMTGTFGSALSNTVFGSNLSPAKREQMANDWQKKLDSNKWDEFSDLNRYKTQAVDAAKAWQTTPSRRGGLFNRWNMTPDSAAMEAFIKKYSGGSGNPAYAPWLGQRPKGPSDFLTMPGIGYQGGTNYAQPGMKRYDMAYRD